MGGGAGDRQVFGAATRLARLSGTQELDPPVDDPADADRTQRPGQPATDEPSELVDSGAIIRLSDSLLQ